MDLSSLDRLALTIISGSQADLLMKSLTRDGFRFTVINSITGVMQETVTCLMVGFSHERMSKFMEIIQTTCHAYRKYIPTQGMMPLEQASLPMVEAQLGGATIYLMNVEKFIQI